MKIEEINKLLERRESLTEEEKKILADAIYNNKEAREIAINGALIMGNNDLAIKLLMSQ